MKRKPQYNYGESKWNVKNIFFTLFIIICVVLLVGLIIYQIKENLEQYDPKIMEIKEKLSQVHPVAHKLRFYSAKKSYTINKEKVHICLRDENSNYYDDNMLMYVSLHELAHVLCDEIGHTEKFNAIFDELLVRAEKMNLYDPDIPPIINYCNSKYHNEEE
jgi:hypothetical protein